MHCTSQFHIRVFFGGWDCCHRCDGANNWRCDRFMVQRHAVKFAVDISASETVVFLKMEVLLIVYYSFIYFNLTKKYCWCIYISLTLAEYSWIKRKLSLRRSTGLHPWMLAPILMAKTLWLSTTGEAEDRHVGTNVSIMWYQLILHYAYNISIWRWNDIKINHLVEMASYDGFVQGMYLLQICIPPAITGRPRKSSSTAIARRYWRDNTSFFQPIISRTVGVESSCHKLWKTQ